MFRKSSWPCRSVSEVTYGTCLHPSGCLLALHVSLPDPPCTARPSRRPCLTSARVHRAAEQKRQRVKELEERIKALMHKMKEQERLLRMKRAADDKVVQLNKEIQNIKNTRVKLIRQMKEDGDK